MSPPKRHNCDIWRVAQHCGVYLSNGRRDVRKHRVCHARDTLRRIGRAHGEGHLALVLRLIVETKGNSDQLYIDTLWAISGLLQHHPELVERGTALFEQFDQIDLKTVRQQAKHLARGMHGALVMRVLLALKLGVIEW